MEELFDNIYYPGLGNYINFYLSLTRYLEGNLCFWKLFNKNDNILKIYIYYDGHWNNERYYSYVAQFVTSSDMQWEQYSEELW